MFEQELYITITGVNHYYDLKPFRIGSLISLQKEPDNTYDNEAISVHMPMLGKVGYVANSPQTVITGCMSAGRLYKEIPAECAAFVRFISNNVVIARVMPDKKMDVKVELALEDIAPVEEDVPDIAAILSEFEVIHGTNVSRGRDRNAT